MVEFQYYEPQEKLYSKVPFVLGLPGLSGDLKGGRIDKMFKKLSKQGFACGAITYDGITRRGNKITVGLDMETYVGNIREAFSRIKTYDFVDLERVGVLSSSVGSGLFTKAFIDNQTAGIEVRSHASISPMLGWKYFSTKNKRRGLYLLKFLPGVKDEIEISSQRDKKNGLKRVIPGENVRKLRELDVIDSLKKSGKKLEQLTLYGKNDLVSQVPSIKNYHERIDNGQGIIQGFDAGHDIPMNEAQNHIEEFLKKTLQPNDSRELSVA